MYYLEPKERGDGRNLGLFTVYSSLVLGQDRTGAFL
jgi:hypothetical protein